jgi:hypothetical protein
LAQPSEIIPTRTGRLVEFAVIKGRSRYDREMAEATVA